MNPDNANRVMTKKVISLLPGIHLRRLQKMLGTSFTTARYHVSNLERDGEIVATKDGRYDRLYPVGISESLKPVYACLQSDTVRTVLCLVADSPDELTKTDISSKVNLAASTVGECMSILEQASLVRRAFTSDGRVVYALTDAERILPLLAVFRSNLLQATTDNFLSLWDI